MTTKPPPSPSPQLATVETAGPKTFFERQKLAMAQMHLANGGAIVDVATPASPTKPLPPSKPAAFKFTPMNTSKTNGTTHATAPVNAPSSTQQDIDEGRKIMQQHIQKLERDVEKARKESKFYADQCTRLRMGDTGANAQRRGM